MRPVRCSTVATTSQAQPCMTAHSLRLPSPIPATSTALICANAGQVTSTRRPLATGGGLGVSVTRLAGHPKQPAHISRRFRQELHEGEVSGTLLAWSFL